MRKASLLLLALVVGCQGCDALSNSRAREKSLVQLYASAVKVLTVARKDGRIDDATWGKVKLAIREARGARIAVKKARESGQKVTVGVLLDGMMRAMAQVIAYKESLQ